MGKITLHVAQIVNTVNKGENKDVDDDDIIIIIIINSKGLDVMLVFSPQSEVSPSIFSSGVVCFFSRLPYTIMLVLVTSVCPVCLSIVATLLILLYCSMGLSLLTVFTVCMWVFWV
jgi:hypothetical protein